MPEFHLTQKIAPYDKNLNLRANYDIFFSLHVQISKQYRSHFTTSDALDGEEQSGISEESEQVLMALERISASCSPLTMSASAFGSLPGSSAMGWNT